MESKEKRRARLKAMRKKYHLGEFKTKHSSKRKVYKVQHSISSMAKRRGRKSARRSSRSSSSIPSLLMGGAGVLLYKNLLSSMIPLQGTTKTIVEIGAGYYLSKKSGFVGNFGKALVLIDAYALAHTYVAPMLNSSVGGSSVSAYYY